VPFPVRRGRMAAGAAPVAGGPRLGEGWPVGSLRWAEFKLRGHAAEITGDALRTATADSIETVSGWRPPRTWLYLAVTVRAAACLAWAGEQMTLTRRDGDHGLRGPERRRLDPDAGHTAAREGSHPDAAAASGAPPSHPKPSAGLARSCSATPGHSRGQRDDAIPMRVLPLRCRRPLA